MSFSLRRQKLRRIAVRVVRAARRNLPEALVGNVERRVILRIRKPGREEAVAPATVVHAAGVEPAQQRRDVQPLAGPVPIHDSVFVPDASSLEVAYLANV